IIKASDAAIMPHRFFVNVTKDTVRGGAPRGFFSGRRALIRSVTIRSRRTRADMTNVTETQLREHLGAFVVPQTGRPLGTAGTGLTLEPLGTGWRVQIRCGDPMKRSGAGLIEALETHCRPLGASLELSITSEVVAHAVQHGLKPLPGVRNLVAVASGKGGV